MCVFRFLRLLYALFCIVNLLCVLLFPILFCWNYPMHTDSTDCSEYNAEIGDGVASQCVMRIAQWSIVSISSKPNNFACWRAMFSRFADHHSDCRHRRRRLWLCRWFTKVSVDLHSITSWTLSTQTIYTQLPAHISLTRDSSHCTFSPAAFLAHLQWASSILGSSTVTARQLKHIISEQFNLINRHYLWGQRTENWTHSK